MIRLMRMSTDRSRRRAAFTLIELMIVVVILGVLAAIGIPSFMSYVRRAKSSEATAMLSSMYALASSLFVSERTGQGTQSLVVTSCVAEPNTLTPGSPAADKQLFTGGPGFNQLGFRIADYVYFGYGLQSIGNAGGITCFTDTSAYPSIYTFTAQGDLDGDGERSTFELAVGSDSSHQLFHAKGIYIADDNE